MRPNEVSRYAGHSMARMPPPLSTTLLYRLQRAFGDTVEAYIVEWKRIWWILCSVGILILWIQRNQVVHEQQQFHSRGVSKRFALTAFGNHELYRHKSTERYILGFGHSTIAVHRDIRHQHCSFQSTISCGGPRTTTGPFDTGVANLA